MTPRQVDEVQQNLIPPGYVFMFFWVELGIDSMSLNPDSVLKTLLMVAEVEKLQS
ncbi:MAG TPA: hypothetical protein V6C91_14505 [Coleofasciculaceae cyanobacterium]